MPWHDRRSTSAATNWRRRYGLRKYALKDSIGHIYEELARSRCTAGSPPRSNASRRRYPNPMTARTRCTTLLDRLPLPDPAGRADDRHRQQPADRVAVELLRHRPHASPADSYGGIIRIDEEQVQIDETPRRRRDTTCRTSGPPAVPVLNSALTSTGIVPFMERYSNSTREVAQDGRRGALMLTHVGQAPRRRALHRRQGGHRRR